MHGRAQERSQGLTTSLRDTRHQASSRFYWIVGMIATGIILVGFSRSYFLRPLFDFYRLSWLAHAHGISMMLFYVLFLTQTFLVQKGNVALHRRLGLLAAVLIPVCLLIGIPNMIAGARLGHTPIPAAPFTAVSTALFLQFAVLGGLGLAMRRRPEIHKRLMVLTLISTLSPAFSRMPFGLFFIGFPYSILFWSNALVLACWVHDWRKTGRIHPVFLWGGAFLFIFQALSFPIGETQIWGRITAWMLAF